MSLSTIIHAGLTRPSRVLHGLVLMGGGARTAYQVGVLQALGAMLELGATPPPFPFQVLVGTSAGALNVAYLAGAATNGVRAFGELAHFWSRLRSSDVYELDVPRWVRFSRVLAAMSLWRNSRRDGAILDNMPLVDTLHHAVSLEGIEASLKSRAIEAVAVTASSYTSGVHWTFCHTARDGRQSPWNRPGRRAEFQPLTIEHLMASSAIPFLFPSTPLWVDGRREFFGDGSMRQISPLSPAMHLGAHKILVVGVGQPQRSGLVNGSNAVPSRGPNLGGIAGHAMASVFHDTLQADVEQAQRVTKTLQQLPREIASVLPYRSVEVLSIQPTQSLDALAQKYAHELPHSVRRALGGLGALKGGGGALASYLLFEPGFVQALIALGEQDAYARKEELLSFLMTVTA
ncbi:patatin-like phospholipase family protein [Caenimonas aquaedulcis]|uniref:Patatin-like phospholipase family protein n=1 Tax=Caenimonas aquaedulcis TaxID=2793270 RepID=A0A931MHW2_9BURK|nr:patatin-like phospholipase family protein [Caenimonas aquaedulcis]MBG9389223.1 patatin-like phospholipase family protein [Caenimonas aquaedulcis]